MRPVCIGELRFCLIKRRKNIFLLQFVTDEIDGSYKTINWHVDEMLTHVSQEVLDQIVLELSKKFGKEDPLSIHTGDVHDYLGMTIDFSKERWVFG
jgi:hypothetical protein